VKRAAVAATAAVWLAACFSTHEPNLAVGVTCERAAQPAGPDSAIIVISDFVFAPTLAGVDEGTTVVWVNCEEDDVTSHTATAEDGAWDSGSIAPGESFAVVVEEGAFEYECAFHPFMRGQVVAAAR
jgi:plastocyanin